MAKGDRIDVTYRTGGGIATNVTIARKSGRSVDYGLESEAGLKWVVVKESTRGGTTVAESRIMASEVLAIEVEKKEME